MLLAEVLVAVTAVAQAKHRHHEEERDQAKRRKDDGTAVSYGTALLPSSTKQHLVFLLSPQRTKVLLWKGVILSALLPPALPVQATLW